VSEKENQAVVPYFIHEGMMTRMQMAMENVEHGGKRMLIALWSVCITLLLAVIIFVAGYTINNQNWMKYTEQLCTSQAEDTVNEAEVPKV